jgi:hypothetical protein
MVYHKVICGYCNKDLGLSHKKGEWKLKINHFSAEHKAEFQIVKNAHKKIIGLRHNIHNIDNKIYKKFKISPVWLEWVGFESD